MLEDREWDSSAPVPSAVGATAAVAPSHESDHTAVFPSPLTTAGAVGIGGTIGFLAVSGLVTLRADPVFGVAVIVTLYSMAMLGLKHLTDARTEFGRAVAVALNALAIGGTLGGLTVLV